MPLQFPTVYRTDRQCFLSSVKMHLCRNPTRTCTTSLYMRKNSMVSLTRCPIFCRGAHNRALDSVDSMAAFASNSTQFANRQWCVSVSPVSPVLLIHLHYPLYQSMPLLVLDRWSKFRIAAACIELEITKFVSSLISLLSSSLNRRRRIAVCV